MMTNIENNPFLRPGLMRSNDGRFIIDSSPRRSGKTYNLCRCIEYINRLPNIEPKIVSNNDRIYRYIDRLYNISNIDIIRPHQIMNAHNVIYFIDEFDFHITTEREFNFIIRNNLSNFYITGTPSHYNSMMARFCRYIIGDNDLQLNVEHVRSFDNGRVEPWYTPTGYRRRVVEKTEETLFIEDNEDNSYLFRIGI